MYTVRYENVSSIINLLILPDLMRNIISHTHMDQIYLQGDILCLKQKQKLPFIKILDKALAWIRLLAMFFFATIFSSKIEKRLSNCTKN